MRARYVSFVLLAGLVAIACGVGLGGGGVYQYAVDVTNSGNQPASVAISMADGSVTRNIPAGDTTRLTGYANGAYSVAVVLDGPAKDAYVAKLQEIKSNLAILRSAHDPAALQMVFENLPTVEQQLRELISSNAAAGCGGTLTYKQGLATVNLTNPSGVWRGTCAVSDYGSKGGSGGEPPPG